MSLTTIQFTQEQAREIARISLGDVRQWRKAVAYLAAKPGKAARFAFCDLVGLSMTREITSTLGARISEVGLGVDALFRTLAVARPTHLGNAVAMVERERARLVPVRELSVRHFESPAFIISCDLILAEIGSRMMPVSANLGQAELPFPPRVVRS